MASIRKDTSGKLPVWRVRVRIGNYPTHSATFATKAEADAYALQTEKNLRTMPKGSAVSKAKDKVLTLGEAIGRYRLEVLPIKRRATIISQAQQLTWWCHRLGRVALGEVTPFMVAEAKGELTARGCKGSTVNRYLSSLSHVYTVAIKEWFLDVNNPVARVRRMSEPSGRTRYLSDDERQRLLAECKASANPILYPVVLLALSSGMRRNEILTLRWKDIDLNHEVIKLGDSKNHEPRVIPLTGHVLDTLKNLALTAPGRESYVFKSPNAERPYNIISAWLAALRRARIEDFCFHSLRHTVGSYLAMQGCTQLDIAKVLGHKKVATTQRYTHLSTSHIRGILDNLTSAL